MTTFSDVFNKDAFYIEKIVLNHNSPQREFLVRVNNYQYLMPYREMERLCNTYGISIKETVMNPHIPRQTYDNRPLWKKDMDMRMGKSVDFNSHALHSPTISADRVLALIGNRASIFSEKIEEIDDYERD